MAQPFLLLALPPELRGIVYEHYLFEPDGYHYDYATGKFRRPDGGKIHLDLMFTCKQVAEEVRKMVMDKATFVFSTEYAKDQQLAARYKHIFDNTIVWRNGLELGVDSTLEMDQLGTRMTPALKSIIEAEYPAFKELMYSSGEEWEAAERGMVFVSEESPRWGYPWSCYQEFLHFTLKVLAVAAGYPEPVDYKNAFYSGWCRKPPDFSPPDLWDEFSEKDIAQLEEGMSRASYFRHRKTEWWYYCTISAASVAIQYLKSVSQSQRLRFKKIVLREERYSMLHPFCHATGLIPFCVENPNLRIERRVNVWKTVLVWEKHSLNSRNKVDKGPSTVYAQRRYEEDIKTRDIGNNFALWINEALALTRKGMPRDSFSLIFDGNPAPDQSSTIFEIVKRDAAWQAARDRWMAENPHKVPSYREQRIDPWFRGDDIPSTIKQIVDGSSFIKCNFETGLQYDLDTFYTQICGQDAQDFKWWAEQFRLEHDDQYVELLPPLPHFPEMCCDEIFPRTSVPIRE